MIQDILLSGTNLRLAENVPRMYESVAPGRLKDDVWINRVRRMSIILPNDPLDYF